MGFAKDFTDAHDLFLIAGVIEEKFIAFFHFLQIPPCGEVSHPTPRFTFAAAFYLVGPGKFFRLGLQQPIRHYDFLRRIFVSAFSLNALTLPP
jgi:hypothetical protein